MAGWRLLRSLAGLGLLVMGSGCGRTLPYPADDETVLAIRILPKDPVLYLQEEIQLAVEATVLRQLDEAWDEDVREITREEGLRFGVNGTGIIEIRDGTTLLGRAAGAARLTASYQGRQDVCDILVWPAGLVELTVLPPALALALDGRAQLKVIGEMADGYRLVLTDPATGTTFESSDPAVAQVSAGGQVLGLKRGRSTVLVQHTTFQAIVEVEVGPPR